MSKEEIPRDLQFVGLFLAVYMTAMLVERGNGIDGAVNIFLASLPGCVVGLVIYKLWVGDEFKFPKSWPEWLLFYLVGAFIGALAIGVAKFVFQLLA